MVGAIASKRSLQIPSTGIVKIHIPASEIRSSALCFKHSSCSAGGVFVPLGYVSLTPLCPRNLNRNSCIQKLPVRKNARPREVGCGGCRKGSLHFRYFPHLHFTIISTSTGLIAARLKGATWQVKLIPLEAGVSNKWAGTAHQRRMVI